jgi:hypothetical protein
LNVVQAIRLQWAGLTLSDDVAVDWVVVDGDTVVGPLTSVFADLESEVVAVLCVVSVGLTVTISAVSVFAVRLAIGV